MSSANDPDQVTDGLTLSRRSVLLGASSLAIGGLAEGHAAPASAAADDLTGLSASDAVRHMLAGDITAERYAEALITRCQAQRDLNAFISFEPDLVREAAREADRRRRDGKATGLLHGLPIPIKDSLNTADYPTTGGTPALRSFRPGQDAPLVAALRARGAVVLGKTNLHELSYGWTSNNLAYGAVHNPYDPACIPGGSSGGTAAAVAARMAPLGVAEDTEGSIRVPAAFCGLTALRPTTRRYSTEGAVPISALFDQTGPHARQVADLQLFDHAVTGEAPLPVRPSLRGLRRGHDGRRPDSRRARRAAAVPGTVRCKGELRRRGPGCQPGYTRDLRPRCAARQSGLHQRDDVPRRSDRAPASPQAHVSRLLRPDRGCRAGTAGDPGDGAANRR